MDLATFQRRTVDVALQTLKARGPRRFLVADEVGLGKTVIARTIAKELRATRKRLNVMYLCPSLEIAGQNRPKFVSLTGIDEREYDSGEDRLALVPGAPPQEGGGFRIFTFTPETSLPGWKPGPRTGRKAERELIRSVLDRFPLLRSVVLDLDRDRAVGRRRLLPEHGNLNGYTAIGIERAMRDIFNCPTGNVEKAVLVWLERKDVDVVELVARFRSVLALAALRSKTVKPDLVILDEFHRYADLILPRTEHSDERLKCERARVHRLLVDALLGGEDRPAVLLLSATPYRLRRLDGEEIHPVDHYRSLIDLVGFLADDQDYKAVVESAFRRYHDALRTAGTPEGIRNSVYAAKSGLEELLRPLMARTERALVHEKDLFERKSRQVKIEAQDLILFKHFAETSGSEFAGWAPAMWSSIPYPSQTMHGYKVWDLLAAAKPAPIEAGSGRGAFAHPQLRQLAEMAGDPAHLSLPWQPPTVGWWKLEGPWSTKRQLPGKTLLFSKWRGAPTAISALLSIHLSRGLRKPREKAPTPLLRAGGSETGALVGLFMQWPNLSMAVEPLKSANASVATVRRDARHQLEGYLRGRGIKLDGREKRPTWIVAAGVERAISKSTYQRVSSLASRASRGAKARDWQKLDQIFHISPAELAALAEHLLSSPGSIVARCVARHRVPQDTAGQRQRVFGFAWDNLRPYLGHRAFAELILAATRRKRYPEALGEAMVKGGFEAVLDEQMGLLGQFGDAHGIKIIDQLSSSLLDRPGLVQFRHGRTKHRVPVQAVSPFAGGDQSRGGKKNGKRLRSDTLRRAFNSPFWPHMLCTTSIGQEGLDFHLWCSRIVHWDLPGDPVDFEQREGRIARYGSLAVRRSMALRHGGEALSQADTGSPFGRLIALAREVKDGRTGLERWWLPESARPISISFDWSFSLRAARRERMLQDLLYYRLALGQPDPAEFVAMLHRVGAKDLDARSLAIDLSAISRSAPPAQ
ncbi:hypothetical protein B5K05_13475 [Rhizobium phaseoli]|uniref:DEAD/DEAH box helicase n=1 Tax=Rhizobium phaseoli TaxID=396 RepID=UPI000E0D0B0C|nr:DEAD/DEAH box helicase [Rhizobium phaseoli]RDJ10135.1 hypothetical protein B5K04_13450 [Rhizobium phaseoli]RDJ14135.1 hypothetical protein B5K05_13475 [Rhizobium phaseoli]